MEQKILHYANLFLIKEISDIEQTIQNSDEKFVVERKLLRNRLLELKQDLISVQTMMN